MEILNKTIMLATLILVFLTFASPVLPSFATETSEVTRYYTRAQPYLEDEEATAGGFCSNSEIRYQNVKYGLVAQFIMVIGYSSIAGIPAEWFCIGWVKYNLPDFRSGPYFYADWYIHGSYGKVELEDAEIYSTHNFELRPVKNELCTWSAKLDGEEVARITFWNLPLWYHFQVVSESTGMYNKLDGYWYDAGWWYKDAWQDPDGFIRTYDSPYYVVCAYSGMWMITQSGGADKPDFGIPGGFGGGGYCISFHVL